MATTQTQSKSKSMPSTERFIETNRDYFTLIDNNVNALKKAKQLHPDNQYRIAYLYVAEPNDVNDSWSHSTYYLIVHPQIPTDRIKEFVWKTHEDLFEYSDLYYETELLDVRVYSPTK